MHNIVTGEKIQQLCDIYLGFDNNCFNYNPVIRIQTQKHCFLNSMNEPFDNPYIVFCYGHCINLLSQKIHLFKNEFILVSHNSDGEIRDVNEVLHILKYNKVLKWFGQNICFKHDKLFFLPIGIANSQWQHGNLSIFNDENFINNLLIKTNKIYFNFKINTNVFKRQICYDNLINKLQWLNNISHVENLKRLSSYEFCICPEGNGIDTHRLWECLYLKVVPIVIKSEFTDILLIQNIPLVVLSNWEELNIYILNYNEYDFNNINLLDFNNYQKYLHD